MSSSSRRSPFRKTYVTATRHVLWRTLRWRLGALLVTALASGFITLSSLRAPVEAHPTTGQTQQATVPPDPPGTIDGSKNPELISDFKAWEVFFNSVAVPQTAPESKKWEGTDKFRRAQLSPQDTAEVIKAMAEFYERRSELQASANQLRREGSSEEAFAQLQSEARSLVESSRRTLESRLTPDGAARLGQHVVGLKLKIKLLPAPPK